MTDLTEAEQADNVETLDNIFKDEPEKEPEAEAEKAEDEGEDEGESKGATKEKESEEDDDSEDEDSEPPSEEEDRKSIPIAAYHGVKRENAALKERLEKIEAQMPRQDEDAPDPVEDPEGYRQHVRQQAQNEIKAERFTASRSKALETHEDYEEMETEFTIMAQSNPALIEQMNASPDPSAFAYETAKAARQSLTEKIRAEILAEIEAGKPKELSESEKRKAKAAGLPKLTKATASGRENAEREEFDDAPNTVINSMFADQKY